MPKLELPAAPEAFSGPVKAWAQAMTIPTYEPAEPDKNPLFLEKRVYQGSSGRVYPLPVIDAVARVAHDRLWQALHIENEFIRVMILPEIGGRIHIGMDKTNGYDFFYRQNVIKPALVGLAGPWASGGVEFNWPQHHRPATFMPVNWSIEEHADGARTIWLSDHDPMNRLKGMHGVCLRPGASVLELKVRLFNGTLLPQTFLWWANVAVHVHEHYQSFFPPDVHHVADHARRASSEFPLSRGRYYGVDYGRLARSGIAPEQLPANFLPPGNYPANDLSWYANIPVPTSYMAAGSRYDFSGGYDHARQAGLIHVANHHIAPGKKQWTWGNHEFGYAWDRHLTDADGPYIELMAGVFTDNQPDFSFLAPGETRTFVQRWYPIKKIGPAVAANEHAAISVRQDGKMIKMGVAVTGNMEKLTITAHSRGKQILCHTRDATPVDPVLCDLPIPRNARINDIHVIVRNADGTVLIAYDPEEDVKKSPTPPAVATEPPLPQDVQSNDELYTIGLHLDQYRHATRYPELYWNEALHRDPGDSRCLNAMGLWHLRRGEFALARGNFQRAIARITSRNANAYDGEAFYNLGLAHRFLGDDQAAYDAFYKSTWNYAWQSAAFLELARIECQRLRWHSARDHLKQSLRTNMDHPQARNLLAIVLKELGENHEAEALLRQTAELDPLDTCCNFLRGALVNISAHEHMDIALEMARAGFWHQAIAALPQRGHAVRESIDRGTAPLIWYYRAYFQQQSGDLALAQKSWQAAAKANPDWCFPSRLEDIAILEMAMKFNPADGYAPYYLGNLLYDRKRHQEAIKLWEKAVRIIPQYSVLWRNLGVAYFNVQHSSTKAAQAYRKARQCNSTDARLLYEQDQLAKRTGVPAGRRLAELQRQRELVLQRDDLAIEYGTLLNQLGRPEEALAVLKSREFQPWEGGEGLVLAQYVRANLALGCAALRAGEACKALDYFQAALKPPETLGEVRHPLANCSDIYFYIGLAEAALLRKRHARHWWRRAAASQGDFQQMAVKTYSEMTFYRVLALQQLGRASAAERLLDAVDAYAEQLQTTPATIDYFATSLPALLLFDADLQARQTTDALFLKAQVHFARRQYQQAKRLLAKVLDMDPHHGLAIDLLSETPDEATKRSYPRWTYHGHGTVKRKRKSR